MLALIYLPLTIYLGDLLCRRFYRFVSVPHQWAAAVITGLLISSWFTYLAGLLFTRATQPLLWGNALFFVAATTVLCWSVWKQRLTKHGQNKSDNRPDTKLYLPRHTGSGVADWVLIAGYVILVSWMMFASFSVKEGKLHISNPEYSDFGPNTAIMQSFAVGHNFPTEYPHFSGDRIRYHFLFYFQAGNLEFLGLNPPWSLNLLSIATLVAMLILAMTLGEVVFNSRAVGRLGSLLFFFFGSLSYVPLLQRQGSVRVAIQAIRHQGEFLPSIFPYRGEAWGTWSQVTYLNQRHFAFAIGIFLLVLVFLVIRYRTLPAKQPRAHLPADPIAPSPDALPEGAPDNLSDVAASSESFSESQTETASLSVPREASQQAIVATEPFRATLPGFIFSGVLLGLIPMWNSAVFIAAAAMLGVLFLLFPPRRQMLALAVTAGLIAVPQMLYLTGGSGRAQMPKL